MKRIYLLLYYGFARHLPKSTMPVLGKVAWHLREFCGKHLFAECGKDINIEQGAYFGNGRDVQLGNHIGIGKDFRMHNRILTVDDYLMMGEEVLFLGGGIYSQILTNRWGCKVAKKKRRCTLLAMCG